MPPARHHSIILDTDIGSDVDDAMALAVILGRPDLELLGITTVYGDTVLRARLARRYVSLAGRDVPVHPGHGATRSGRDVWWAGHEGSLHERLHNEQIETQDAVSYLTEMVAANPGEIDIVAIGPLTNIAAALDGDPAFERNVRALWVMGGSFDDDVCEHNFASDAAAAGRVLDSAIPTVISGLEITKEIKISTKHLQRVAAAGRLGEALSQDIDQWWKYWNETWNVPHDPVTVLTLAEPELFRLSPAGHVRISQDSPDEGHSTFAADPHGSTRIVVGQNATSVAETMITNITAAGSLVRQT
jgi:purine nucleosidase